MHLRLTRPSQQDIVDKVCSIGAKYNVQEYRPARFPYLKRTSSHQSPVDSSRDPTLLAFEIAPPLIFVLHP